MLCRVRKRLGGRSGDEPRLQALRVADGRDRVRRGERPVVDEDRIARGPDRRAAGQPQAVDGDRLGAGGPQPVHRDLQVAVEHPGQRGIVALRVGRVVQHDLDARARHGRSPGAELQRLQAGGVGGARAAPRGARRPHVRRAAASSARASVSIVCAATSLSSAGPRHGDIGGRAPNLDERGGQQQAGQGEDHHQRDPGARTADAATLLGGPGVVRIEGVGRQPVQQRHGRPRAGCGRRGHGRSDAGVATGVPRLASRASWRTCHR